LKFDIFISAGSRILVETEAFEVKPGKITLLLGESGIGKTLISRAISGLLPEKELTIRVNGRPYAEYLAGPVCRMIQSQGFFVFQEPSSHFNPMLTLEQQLNEGAIADTGSNDAILQQLFPSFSSGELRRLLEVYPKPYRPSGGEKQRMLIAMAFKKMTLLKDTDVLYIFDEPTGNLDNVYRNIFLKLLIQAHQTLPLTSLLITHDYSMISEIQKKYSGMLERIEFTELRISDHHQIQVPFLTGSYTEWLESLRPVATENRSATGPILRMEPEIEVFDRSLTITSDAGQEIPGAMEIFGGDAVYLKAGSGVGKTTVAKIIMGLQQAKRFSLWLKDLNFNQNTPPELWKEYVWARIISMVFQHADEALNLNGKVRDIFRGLPIPKRFDQGFLNTALASVFDRIPGPDFQDMPVAFLSGGQKQRLNLIRAMILEPEILILDEPFNGLDFNTLQRILDLLQDRQKRGKSFLIISHNEEIIDRFVARDRVYHLKWKRLDT
jgi:peptide/nickel transport system ATP-binding protein